MKVSVLQLYLRSLTTALTATNPQTGIATELDEASSALRPFADLEIAQFASLLRKAEEQRREGALSVPSPAGVEVENVQDRLRSLASLAEQVQASPSGEGAQLGADRERMRADLERALTDFLRPLGITARITPDKQNFEALILSARMRSRARQVREHLQGVSDEATLNEPERQEKLAALIQPLDMAEMKALAVEVGVAKVSAKNKEGVFAAIVEAVTSVKATKPKAASSPRAKKPVDAEVVRQEGKLKGLLEKSLDPVALTEGDVDAAIADLEKHGVDTLRVIVQEAGVENVGKSKGDIIKKVRLKLTAARRAQERIEV